VLYIEKLGEHAKTLTEILMQMDIKVIRASSDEEAILKSNRNINILLLSSGSIKDPKETLKEIR
jgi:hypothetical protein